MLSRFRLVPERNERTDRRTDGQTDRRTDLLYQYRASVCWRAIKIVRFWWNSVHCSNYWTWILSCNQKLKFVSFKTAAAAILKIALFGHKSTDRLISAKFCSRKQNTMSTRAKWQNLQIFKIQHGGRPPFWKLLNRHISVKYRPILMKFGTLQQILH